MCSSADKVDNAFIFDVIQLLESYGFAMPTDDAARRTALGKSVGVMFSLVETFEGNK